jgi:hypothetical protein
LSAAWTVVGGVGGADCVTVGVGTVVAGGGCLGADDRFTGVDDGRGVELLLCGVVAAAAGGPLATGVGACTGGAGGGTTVLCGFGLPADGDTTTFAAGGAVSCAPPDGKCTVPDRSSSAIAAAPSRSGIASATTGRAIAQIPLPLSRSSAGNGPFPPPGSPGLPEPGIQESRADGNLPAGRTFALSGESLQQRPGTAGALRRGHVMIFGVKRLLVVCAVSALACCAFARPSSAASGDAVQQLAARYAPVVRLSEQEEPCSSGEAFEPIDVNAIFGNDEVAFRGPWSGANLVKVAPTLADVSSGRYGYALDFPGDALASSACSYEEWQRRITAGRKPTVYAHVATESGRLALQYWFFYVYNDFNNLHEGDWELIQLNFAAATSAAALRTRPTEVGYSQHNGAERAEWGSDKLELVGGTHPVVYPAEGSHANYFSSALFLGASAAQGVGCDDTNEPWTQLRPVVDVIPRSPKAARAAYPWLGYHGLWGEQRRAFFNAPTGPNTRLQWTEPITWTNETWKARSFALVGGRSLGPTATDFFCGAVSAVSTGLILAAARPSATFAMLALFVALLIWLALRTQWRSGPELRRRRPWGSLVTAAARTYRGNVRLFISIGAIFAVLGVVVAALQWVVFRRTGLSSLPSAFGSANSFTETIVLGFGFVVNLLGLTIVQATCARAVVDLDANGHASATRAYRATWRRLAPLLGGLVLAAFLVALLNLTLIGVPIAIWLTIRWSLLAQAVALDDSNAPGSLRRSARLVRRHWWRTATLTVFVTGVALVLGPLVGTLLLFVTSASFDVVNLASDLVYVVALPFAAIATTYLYFDLLSRNESVSRAG